MSKFGKLSFRDKVSTSDGASFVVQVVDKLPAAASVGLGTVYQLAQSQGTYSATHIYMSVLKDGVRRWRDLTDNPEVEEDTSATSFAAGYEYVTDDAIYRLCAWWSTPEDPKDDQWLYDVLVRKAASYPETQRDGEMITFSASRDEYVHAFEACTDDANRPIGATKVPVYPSDDAYHSGVLNGVNDDVQYYYRVFHVFATGKTTYTNCEISDTNYTAGVIGYIKLAKYMDNTVINSNPVNIPYSTVAVWEVPELPEGAVWTSDQLICVSLSNRTIMTAKTVRPADAKRSCMVENSAGTFRAMRTHLSWWGSNPSGQTNMPTYPTGPSSLFIVRTKYTLGGATKQLDRILTYDSGWRVIKEAIRHDLHNWNSTYNYGLLGRAASYQYVSPRPTDYWDRSFYVRDDGSNDPFSIWMQDGLYPGTTSGVWFRCILSSVGNPSVANPIPIPSPPSLIWSQRIAPGIGLRENAVLRFAGFTNSSSDHTFTNPFTVDFTVG